MCPRVAARIACTEGSCEYPYSEACFHPDDLPLGEDPGHMENNNNNERTKSTSCYPPG